MWRWPLGHASLQQTSTYLNTNLRGLHESMRNLERTPLAQTLHSSPRRLPGCSQAALTF
jgi:hypothetical protein